MLGVKTEGSPAGTDLPTYLTYLDLPTMTYNDRPHCSQGPGLPQPPLIGQRSHRYSRPAAGPRTHTHTYITKETGGEGLLTSGSGEAKGLRVKVVKEF